MIYMDNSVLQLLGEKLKIGDRHVNVRVEVDKFDYIPNQISEFSAIMLGTDKATPALNLSGASIGYATTVSFPLQGKALSEFEPIKEYVKFGAPRYRDGKYHHDHRGIDFGAPKGHPVVSVADGEVVAITHNNAYAGNMLEILHDNGYRTVYSHLNNYAKINDRSMTLGTKVHSGEVVAYVGNTGTNEAKNGLDKNYHLHFEIREKATKSDRGNPVDPLPFLQQTKKFREVDAVSVSSSTTQNDNLYYNYITETAYDSNFSNTSEINKFTQPSSAIWGMALEGDIHVLTPKKKVTVESAIYKTYYSTNNTLISIRYKAVLTSGESIKIYIDGQLVHTITESTNVYTTLLIQAPSTPNGTQTLGIAITPNTTLARVPLVYIEKINIVNRYERLSDVASNGVSDIKYVSVISDVPNEVYVKSSPTNSSSNIASLVAGSKYDFIETIINAEGKWYKVVCGGQDGYIESEYSYLDSDTGIIESTYEVPTGAFAYARTIILEDVVSVDIDYKYEMRAAEATITLFNKNGYYNPDYNPASFNDVITQGYSGLLIENAPVRIYLGYGDKLQRRFTGLVSNVSVSSDGHTMVVNCVDMMKLVNDYFTYNQITYGDSVEVWLASSVIQDLVNRAGMNNWRIGNQDINRPSLVIEESYYTDVRPESGTFVTFTENGEEITKTISSIPEGTGFRNPAWWNTAVPVGTNLGDYLENICKLLGYWQRCDCYGTYYATTRPYMNVDSINNLVPQFKFVDGDNLISVNKNYDYSKIRNHLIISGPFDTDHFFDTELFKYTLGARKTASEYYDFANTYGKRHAIAKTLFHDIKTMFRTLQVAVEGNPYIELMDVVEITNYSTNTRGKYIVKGIKDSYTVDQGYITSLDLYWKGAV
jgi:hypothetical protein